MIRIFAGYDDRAPINFAAFQQSLIETTTAPFSLTPLNGQQLYDTVARTWEAGMQSTSFSFTRFLVPYLCDYEGWALFLDGSDMIVKGDLHELMGECDDDFAVKVVKHAEGIHKPGKKFMGMPQEDYPRKNWSSVMLFNCARCKVLTPDVVENESGAYLHRFQWVPDSEIGELPSKWNHLVGVEAPCQDPAIVHYTLGVPLLADYSDCEHADAMRAVVARLGQIRYREGLTGEMVSLGPNEIFAMEQVAEPA